MWVGIGKVKLVGLRPTNSHFRSTFVDYRLNAADACRALADTINYILVRGNLQIIQGKMLLID